MRAWVQNGVGFAGFLGLAAYVVASLPGAQRVEQAEAKFSLAILATAEHAYFLKHGHFTTDLSLLGEIFEPGKHHYRVGFAQGEDAGRKDSTALFRAGRMPAGFSFDASDADFQRLAERLCPDCVVSEGHFKALAVADFGSNGGLDAWTVDESRRLTRLRVGR